MKRVSPRRAAVVIFAVALATLASQVLFHRVISAKLLNNYAFLVISLTMLGFACSGVLLSRKLSQWLERFDELVVRWAALFALTSLAVTVLFYRSAIGSQDFITRSDFVAILLRTIPYALLFATPFFFSGLLLGSILANPVFSSGRMYCWDLVGSGAGAVLVIPLISTWGVEKALLGVQFFLVAVVVLVLRPTGARERIWLGLTAILLIAASVFQGQIFVLRYPEGTMLAASYTEPGFVVEHTVWDPVARIEVSRLPQITAEGTGYPSLMGSNREFLTKFKRVLTQNNFAFTVAVEYDGHPSSLKGIEETIYAGAYLPLAAPRPKVAIIGVGGGFDILTGLAFDAREITGIDINAATLRILQKDYADYFGPWVRDPRVHLVRDDGRHYLSTSPERFDIIQLSGVDTYSGSPGAAHVFSENYLYTLEAFRLYYSRLSPSGVLNVMRLEQQYPRDMLRALGTAIMALRAEGVANPAQQICVLGARRGNFVAVLVKKTPFAPDEVRRLETWGATNVYSELLAAPFFTPAKANVYQMALAMAPAEQRAFFTVGWRFDISPSTDNRPFFFQFARWSHLFSNEPVVKESVPVMQITLCLLFCATGLIALACVWWPLRELQRSHRFAGSWRYGAIFAGTAIAYLAIEMALLQRFGLFLGHPNYALSVVLAGLLFSTGIGAFLSTRLSLCLHGPRSIAYVLAAVVLAECQWAFPALYDSSIESFLVRTSVVLLLIAPLGILMGAFVPLALDGLKRTAPALVPWAWGVNGIFSVLAPILSIAFSITWGIDALLLASIPLYLVVSWCFPKLAAQRVSDPASLPASGP